ncbi:MAG: hypothetical protein SPL13_01775 [Clostridia bacterium]|nr:hypothetical protein [Clostridia bacterium]
MIDFYSLVKTTKAFSSFNKETFGNLSHAYLIVHPDGDNLLTYLKIFAKAAVKGDERVDTLIDEGYHPDVKIYPVGRDNVLTEDVADLINESYVKPIESDKKIFIVNRAETMNQTAQNKLLKTLEEPPKNVTIFLGATSEYPLIATVKSRVRKIFIPEFDGAALFNALKEDCPDFEKLNTAIACGDGTVGKAYKNYHDEKLGETVDAACDMLVNMKSSKNVLEFSRKIVGKYEINDFLNALKTILRDMLANIEGKPELIGSGVVFEKASAAEGFTEGAIIYAIEKIREAEERLKFNSSEDMVCEWLMFQILEGKYKWRKL